MQSGITASQDLHAAFQNLLSDPSIFALPITITAESLTPVLPLLHFQTNSNNNNNNGNGNGNSSSSDDSFSNSLPQLKPHLTPTQPTYLVLRRSSNNDEDDNNNNNNNTNLVLITYIPSTAAVRAKTLFASTRATVLRELGRERFESGNIFVTEASEVLDVEEWRVRDGGGAAGQPLTREERDDRALKRAEEEMVGGGGGGGGGMQGREMMGLAGRDGSGDKRIGVRMKVEDGVSEALAGMAASEGVEREGRLVQLAIDVTTEILGLSLSRTPVAPAEVSSQMPTDRPSYSFYQYPSSASPASPPIIFIYCCPGSSKIKERMVHASSRASVVQAARDAGVEVVKRIEVGAPDEVNEARLMDEIAESASATATGGGDGEIGSGAARQAFARPKRPGRR